MAEASPESRLARQAAKHKDEGLALLQQGEYERAIDELQIAYGLFSEPILLYHLAEAYDLKEEYAEALYYYRSYLDEDPEGAAERGVAERVEAIGELVEGKPEQAAEPPPEPEPQPEPPPDFQPDPDPEVAEVAMEGPAASTPGRGLRISGLITLGAGVVLGGAGGYFAMQARTEEQEISELFEQGVTWQPEFDDKYEEGRRSRRYARVLAGAGGAAVLTGAALYYFGVRSGRAGRVEVAPSPGGATVSLSWEL